MLNIRELRIKKGLTQDKLAKLLGYKNRSVACRIEKGQRVLKEKDLKKLSKIFNISIKNLLLF